MQRIYIAGGYGVIGSAVARHIRTICQETEIILAGRNPEGEFIGTRARKRPHRFLDIRQVWLQGAGSADLIVSTIQDPADLLIQEALAKELHISGSRSLPTS